MTTYELLKQAIIEKKQVIAYYSGKQRYLCPHVIGTKNGKEHCLFYQFDGESTSGLIVYGSEDNWRCMEIAKLSDVSLCDGTWHTVANFDTSTQTCIDNVDMTVS